MWNAGFSRAVRKIWTLVCFIIHKPKSVLVKYGLFVIGARFPLSHRSGTHDSARSGQIAEAPAIPA